MELDELKSLWSSLEKTRTVNEALLRELKLGRARSALIPTKLGRALEVLLGLSVLALCAPVVLSHLSSWRYLAFGVPSLLYMAATTGLSAYLLIRTSTLDFDGPLLSIQREVAELRRVELRATLIAMLGGIVLWLPVGLLLFEAVTASPLLDAVDLAWLVSNIAFGLIVLAVARALASRFRSNRIFDALTGRGLRFIDARIEELDVFGEASGAREKAR